MAEHRKWITIKEYEEINSNSLKELQKLPLIVRVTTMHLPPIQQKRCAMLWSIAGKTRIFLLL
jgi:hypothetical protein